LSRCKALEKSRFFSRPTEQRVSTDSVSRFDLTLAIYSYVNFDLATDACSHRQTGEDWGHGGHDRGFCNRQMIR